MNFPELKSLAIPQGEVVEITSGNTMLWKSVYTNQVPISTDTDGSIYQNGKGYIDGYRLSSSGSLKSQANTVATGFIKATKNDVVRMAGTKWNKAAGYNYFAMYDKNFTIIETINWDGTGDAATKGWSHNSKGRINADETRVYVENDITRFHIVMKSGYEFAYVRISAYGSGEEMIVTVNEEIA